MNARLIPLTAGLIPLLLAPGLCFYYDVTPKVVWLLGAAAVVLWNLERVPRRVGLLAGLTALSLTLATAASSDSWLSLVGTDWRRGGLAVQCAILVVALGAAALGLARNCGRAVAMAGIPIAVYGIAQYFGWDPWLPAQAYHAGEGTRMIVRPPGTLGYVTYFANFLVFATFHGLSLWAGEKGAWRLAGGAAMLTSAAAIILSGTRAALLGLAAGAIVWWLWRGRRRPARLAGTLAVGLAAVALLAISPAGALLRNRALWIAEDLRGGARLWLWRDSLHLVAQHPVLGSGVETFSREFPAVESRDLARSYPDFHHESAHHFLLDAMTAQGAIGGALLMAWIWLGAGALWQACRVDGALAGGMAAALAGSVMAHQFSVFIAPTALCFYLIVMQSREGETQVGLSGWRRLGSLALGGMAIWLAVGDRRLNRAATAFAAGRPERAAVEYRAARAWRAGGDLWYSRRMAEAAAKVPVLAASLPLWQEALEAGMLATRTAEDRANAWYHLATLQARRGDGAGAGQALRQTVAAAPYWFKPHWTLARLLALEGRREEARREALEARDLDAGVHPEVAQTTEVLLR